MMPRRAAREMPGHDRDGRRQDQRARRRDHEHGERADRVAGDEPRGAGDHERDRDEDHRVPVRDADERRLLPLRLLDQPHDAGVRALGGGRDRAEVDGATRVHRAGADLVALRAAPTGATPP